MNLKIMAARVTEIGETVLLRPNATSEHQVQSQHDPRPWCDSFHCVYIFFIENSQIVSFWCFDERVDVSVPPTVSPLDAFLQLFFTCNFPSARVDCLVASFSISEECAKKLLRRGSIRLHDLCPTKRASVIATQAYPQRPVIMQTPAVVTAASGPSPADVARREQELLRKGAHDMAVTVENAMAAASVLKLYEALLLSCCQ